MHASDVSTAVKIPTGAYSNGRTPRPEPGWKGFVREHGCWQPTEEAKADEVLQRVSEQGIRSVRVGFVDQHGLVRSKNVAAEALPGVFKNGLSFASSLLSKDTSGTTIFSAFAADGGTGVTEMAGAADMVLVPDPETFRVLPWAEDEGWIIGDLYLRSGSPMPFCSRSLLKRFLGQSEELGFDFTVGVELEFHLFRQPDVAGSDVRALNRGYQLLLDQWGEDIYPLLNEMRSYLSRIDITLATLEVEFGPSQAEVTLSPLPGLRAADDVILIRQAIKTLAKRRGYHATFMCRPKIENSFSSGWHLHQSLVARTMPGEAAGNVFPDLDRDGLSEVGEAYVAGLLRHGPATCVFAVPTINGYKRFQPFTLAPDRVSWARENRGAMLRLVGRPEDGSLHVENRIGEPAANPYLYLGTQLAAGLAGIRDRLTLPPSADNPYADEATRLPTTLSKAIDALMSDSTLRSVIGAEFCDYFLGIKRAEVERFERTVSDMEQAEYFEIF